MAHSLLLAALFAALVSFATACLATSPPRAAKNPCRISGLTSDAEHSLLIHGLISPAVVSGAITVSVTGDAGDGPITFCIDGVPLGPTHATTSTLYTLSVRQLSAALHHLQVIASSDNRSALVSNVVAFYVVPDLNVSLSGRLTPPAPLSNTSITLQAILQQTSTPNAALTLTEEETRSQIAAMYLNFGFDLSLDATNDLSDLLPTLLPTGWALPARDSPAPLSMRFSPDAPFYQPIPASWPHVPLPTGYIKTIQLNTNRLGDGIGYGISIATVEAATSTITSQWQDQISTLKHTPFPVASDWENSIPTQKKGDRHVIFINPADQTFVSLYKTSADAQTQTPHALYASSATSFNSLGDVGGSTASRFSELPLLLMPGEATRGDERIRHALGGPVQRVWAARVYPATARDYGMLDSVNTCTGSGIMNTGLVPYGGIIQLDPALRLDRLQLTRPARRILQAIQTYGYYVMDFGCADLDIYTAISEEELLPYGGLYGIGATRTGVQKEVADVLTSNILYVTPPPTKRP